MFEIIYLFVIVLAALPLARTLMIGAGGKHIAFVHRLYRDAAYILAAVLGIIALKRRSASPLKTTGFKNWVRVVATGCLLNIVWQFSLSSRS